jgi:hypothetical protein
MLSCYIYIFTLGQIDFETTLKQTLGTSLYISNICRLSCLTPTISKKKIEEFHYGTYLYKLPFNRNVQQAFLLDG